MCLWHEKVFLRSKFRTLDCLTLHYIFFFNFPCLFAFWIFSHVAQFDETSKILLTFSSLPLREEFVLIRRICSSSVAVPSDSLPLFQAPTKPLMQNNKKFMSSRSSLMYINWELSHYFLLLKFIIVLQQWEFNNLESIQISSLREMFDVCSKLK